MALSFKGAHFPPEIIFMGGPMVRSVPLEPAPRRRTHVQNAGWSWITPPSTAGSSHIAPGWQTPSSTGNSQAESAGAGMRGRSRGKARGGICLVLVTNRARRLTVASPHSGPSKWPSAS